MPVPDRIGTERSRDDQRLSAKPSLWQVSGISVGNFFSTTGTPRSAGPDIPPTMTGGAAAGGDSVASGLSGPGASRTEGRDLSPNEMFAACVGITGYVPLPLTGDDYIELLPASFRTLNDYGLTIDNRTCDCKALNPYRRLDSGLPGGNRKKWEVHYQPYDITIVWLRDHCSDEWFTVPWVYRSVAGQPFGLAL
jgi:hypothetical protein